jgi:glycosyltransferase involved in cell wall biosynthesis
MKKTVVLIPAFNPDEKLLSLLNELRPVFKCIVIVNDGSIQGNNILESISDGDVHVLKHDVNRGKGAALKTGMKWILKNIKDCSAVVTADADGQHRPDDILRVAKIAIDNPSALTLGVRAFTGNVPLRSRFGNWLTRQIFFLTTGMHVVDTQTGLRGIPISLIPRFLKIPGDRYEYEMAMLADARHHITPPLQIPIETVYIANNSSSHFKVVRDSVRIYGALLHFCASSIGCFLLDNAVFTLALVAMMRLTDWKRASNTFVAICIARIVSATVNYLYNRHFVFRADQSGGVSFLRYWMLVFFIMSTGYGCTAALSRFFDINGVAITLIKISVETVLFLFSFHIQRKWVFSTHGEAH